MAFALYDATVPVFSQILGGLAGVLGKAEAHCAQSGLATADCIGGRLYEDMLPLGFQVQQAAAHSVGALAATQRGVFSPHMAPFPDSFAGLNAIVLSAIGDLGRFTPDEINALEGRDMAFEFKDRKLAFTAEAFLMSFSLPNFFFHASTAYDILRHKGVPLGKRDFMGQLRLKQ